MYAIRSYYAWLPASGGAHQVSLVSGTLQVVAGDPAPQPASVFATAPSARFVSGGGIQRTALACTAISGGGLAVCSATRADLLTLDDLVSLLIFSLLLAAPVLVITSYSIHYTKLYDFAFLRQHDGMRGDATIGHRNLGAGNRLAVELGLEVCRVRMAGAFACSVAAT